MEILDVIGVFVVGVCLGWEIGVIALVLIKKNIYSNGYSLVDRHGNSFVRGTFKSVKKAKIYAEENNLPWWRIVAYNDETNKFDIIEEKK